MRESVYDVISGPSVIFVRKEIVDRITGKPRPRGSQSGDGSPITETRGARHASERAVQLIEPGLTSFMGSGIALSSG